MYLIRAGALNAAKIRVGRTRSSSCAPILTSTAHHEILTQSLGSYWGHDKRSIFSMAQGGRQNHDGDILTKNLNVYRSLPRGNDSMTHSYIPYTHHQYLQHQQLRYRRHDRASAFSKPRPKTKKQRKKFNRKVKKIQAEQEKQKPPGYRAGPLRQVEKERWQQLLDHGKDKEQVLPATEEQYGLEDFLVEELIGNTAHLTSQPTPEPHYLGHKHEQLFQKVQNQMELYRKGAELESSSSSSSEDASNQLLDVSLSSLPSDKAISDVIRAYRDKKGTRHKPIGIVKALQHVLKDLGIPTAAFGEYTFTSLLTCCRTPNEARRIFKLMDQLRHPRSSYSWSILVDVHAKLGDYQGCANVIKEMASEGVAPSQAAYTSLLAACYKICNDGRIPHAIRAEAGNVGWRHWQELRIVGIEADAMAYGAIIRLCAARGQPERAINLLEEMKRFDVKPTTLCFSGALKAVARSHEIAIRFEKGWSRKQLRRESIASHHGKMARTIVVMADNAEVEQDAGLVSALMLCAAAAGDSASAKAILLASEVRSMEQLRTIGPGSSTTQQLEGNLNRETASSASIAKFTDNVIEASIGNNASERDLTALRASSTFAVDDMKSGEYGNRSKLPEKSYGEREYGMDSRVLSALLRACAQAMDSNGIGTIWAGTSNQGFLCENSQRLITTRWEPLMVDSRFPGESSTQVGIGALQRYDQYKDDESDRKKGGRQKFRGMFIEDDPMTRAEMDGSFDADLDDFDLNGTELEAALRSAPFDSDLEQGESMSDFADDETKELGHETGIFDKDKFSEFTRSDEDTLKNAGSDTDNLSADFKNDNIIQSPWFCDNEGEVDLPSYTHDDSDVGRSIENSIIVTEDGSSIPNEIEKVIVDDRLAGYTDKEIDIIEQLEMALPGLPFRRIVKIANVFNTTLGAPSVLQLVPLLRETMPDNLNVPHLVKMNSDNAEFALQKAIETGSVNRQLLDAMLQVKSKSGSLDGAIEFYEEQYRELNTKPNQYGDRLIFEMLVANNRLPRAFAIKEKIESKGRKLDLASYGCIIDYYAKNSQIGSALMMLKECVSIHGAPPSEKHVSKLRRGCREMRIETEARLEDMIGKDPTEWLRHGIKYLKREKSKKGRRHVQFVSNRLL